METCSWEAAAAAPRFASHAWDQSDKFVSVYLDLPAAADAADAAAPPTVGTLFEARRFAVRVGGAAAPPMAMLIPNLCKAIVPAKCKVRVKPTRLVVKLRKEAAGETWSDLTDAVDVKEAARKKRVATRLKDASTQELLADMYAHASDEDRKGLMEAAAAGMKKREAQKADK